MEPDQEMGRKAKDESLATPAMSGGHFLNHPEGTCLGLWCPQAGKEGEDVTLAGTPV